MLSPPCEQMGLRPTAQRGFCMASSVGPTAQVVPGMAKATNVVYNFKNQHVSSVRKGGAIYEQGN